ncbi:FAD-binding and (Fe-S)-binding domain-containing protein [Planctomycetota bacterium]
MGQEKLKEFEQQLRNCVKGDVSFDQATLGLYSTDASIYQITPVALVQPLDKADVCAAIQTAAQYGVSILPRGAGTSLNGQAVGSSMVIDFTKYMNKILELNVDQRWVKVQPGIVLDELNAALAEHNLAFAPDPATSERATIGGMIANNSSGMRSIVYGITQDHVLEVQTLLSDGTIMALKELSPDELDYSDSSRQLQIFSGFKKIIEDNRDEIETRYPKVMRRVQGYNLDSFINTRNWNLAELMVGSEGTLGVFLDAKLNLEPLPKAKVLCIVHFAKLDEAIRSISPILKHQPSAIEIVDDDVLGNARKNIGTAKLCGFIQDEPKAILITEFFGDDIEQATQKAQNLAADMQNQQLGYAWPVIADPDEQKKVWTVRKNGLGLMINFNDDRKPVAFIEDSCVPLEHLADYVDQILKFCKSRSVPVSMYAHASVGVIHVRPLLNLKLQSDIDNMKDIADFAFELVKKYGGSLSGEHGDGRVRSPKLESYFGTQIYDALRQVKNIFDPAGLMNPGVIVDAEPMDTNLRYGSDYKTLDIPTQYHYRDSAGFFKAVEKCLGIGLCRQKLENTMCPSYRATLDEQHSTRGRANALRLAMSGQLGADAMTSKRLFEIMELCLSCKSCKTECPSNVDMTRLKSDFLQNYHDANGFGLRERLIANSTTMAKIIAGPLAPIVNFGQKTWLFRKALEIVAGFDSRRTPPEYARVPFAKWFARREKTNGKLTKKVVLFEDTYLSYHQTSVGISAVELLESCGYEVILANAGCCQRPRISHGFLRQAKAKGEKTLQNLDKFIQQRLKIVVCEPGCCSALIDDLPDLIDDEQLGNRIKQNVMMIDEFLAGEIDSGNLSCRFTSPFSDILIHGHCHQKSLFGTTAMKNILNRIDGIIVTEIDSGCCGMAGSFGYEKEHYDMSIQIGEQGLFPAVRNRKPETAVVACGFSCRHQIEDGTGVKALHWVETIRGENTND